MSKQEITSLQHDPRFSGNVKKLRDCSFIGATTNNPESLANKLYSPHLPFSHYNERWLKTYKDRGLCGRESNVYAVGEQFIREAQVIIESQDRKIQSEPSALAGLGLMLQMKDQLPRDKKILIVSTGYTKL